MQETGFEIYNKFYPLKSFRLGDPVLVRAVTGMEWPEFAEAVQAIEENDVLDQVPMVGLAAVCFWQGNPQMSRDKVKNIIEHLSMDDCKYIQGDEDIEDVAGDARPPAGAEPETTTTPSVSSAEVDETTIEDSGSDETNHRNSGNRGLETSSLA